MDQIAGELYGLQPDAFAAARDERVRAARAEGQQRLARELARLRRPTQSAWLINLLWRDQQDVMEQFLQLGGELARAQAEASGPELHRLTALRRELEAALIRTARGLAQKAGVNISASMEREAQETLSAALARPDVAEQVRTGRLVKPAAYAGFGTLMPPGPAAPPQTLARQPVQAPRPQAARAPTRLDDRTARAAQRARERREEAERGVQEARAALDAAAQEVAQASAAADAAREQHTALRRQAEQLEQQLGELQDRLVGTQREAAAAGHASLSAGRRKQEAETAHHTALRALQRAEQSLNQISA